MSKGVVLAWLTVGLIVGSPASGYGQAGDAGYALRFYGNGVDDIDRVKIQVDDPVTITPGPPADVGATDFTLEFWLKATALENGAPGVQCGANNNWIYGNIVVDRDRFNQGRSFGLSIAGGVVVFGVSGDRTGHGTICGTTNVLDGQWHHIAIQRRRADGWLWLYVDGRLEAQADGPDGDISYPDDGIPGNFCGGPCINSDPYLVLGAEKHDAGPQFPSFAGWLDEMRLSNVLRYPVNFTRPSAPFAPDLNTVALYHFDEGSGDVIIDSSGALGGPSDGVRRFGGTPPGPEWVLSDAPFGSGPRPSDLVAAYSFDEGSGSLVSDVSGNGNTGTLSGAIWTSLGRFGGALVFNGANAWVTVNDSASLDLFTGMTLEAWVYPTVGPSAWRTVIAKEGSGTVMAYFLHASSSPDNQPATGLTSEGIEQQLRGGTPLAVDTWTHLAATYDGAVQRLYLNGVHVASRPQTGAIVNTVNPLRIGGNSIWGEYFQGRIDEVRIYNRALSQAEIQTDMNTPVSPVTNPVPTTTGLSPASAPASGPGFILTVTGTNFIGSSVVRWNGADRATTYGSAMELTAAISAEDIAVAGTATVTVFTPAPGGGTSNPQTFTITTAASGLVAAYSFNEGSGPTVSDVSGNGNTGSISGATWTSLGRFGGALVFTGAVAWVTVNDSASLDLSTGMTLEAWVFPTVSPTDWRTVLAKEGQGTVVAYFLHASSSPGNEPATGVTIGGIEQQLRGGTPLAVDTWTHLAATYDGAVQRLYVNGVPVASRPQTGAIVNTVNPLRIGGNSIWGEYFQGGIDEVRIYNRALSQAEIQNDMNTPVSP